MKSTRILLSALALAAAASPLAAQDKAAQKKQSDNIDKRLPKYERVDVELSGDLNAVGSDTMINLMTLWGERFKTYYPEVRIQVEGKGSSTAPPALIQGTAQFGPMSRKMKDKEVDAFIEQFDYEPTPMQVCLDALALFVHMDNPIAECGLTMEQVDAIFSKTRKLGGRDITRWGELGLDGSWTQVPISLYGRNSASGTYGYFKKVALAKGDYKETVKEQTGSALGGAVDHRGQVGHRLLRHRLQDLGRGHRAALRGRRRVLRRQPRERGRRRLSVGPLPERLHQPGAEHRDGAAPPRVLPLRVLARGPADRREGRLPADQLGRRPSASWRRSASTSCRPTRPRSCRASRTTSRPGEGPARPLPWTREEDRQFR